MRVIDRLTWGDVRPSVSSASRGEGYIPSRTPADRRPGVRKGDPATAAATATTVVVLQKAAAADRVKKSFLPLFLSARPHLSVQLGKIFFLSWREGGKKRSLLLTSLPFLIFILGTRISAKDDGRPSTVDRLPRRERRGK